MNFQYTLDNAVSFRQRAFNLVQKCSKYYFKEKTVAAYDNDTAFLKSFLTISNAAVLELRRIQRFFKGI